MRIARARCIFSVRGWSIRSNCSTAGVISVLSTLYLLSFARCNWVRYSAKSCKWSRNVRDGNSTTRADQKFVSAPTMRSQTSSYGLVRHEISQNSSSILANGIFIGKPGHNCAECRTMLPSRQRNKRMSSLFAHTESEISWKSEEGNGSNSVSASINFKTLWVISFRASTVVSISRA
jgi:hypothetical protein